MGHRTGLLPGSSLPQLRPGPSTSPGHARWGSTRSPPPPTATAESSLSGPTARTALCPRGSPSLEQPEHSVPPTPSYTSLSNSSPQGLASCPRPAVPPAAPGAGPGARRFGPHFCLLRVSSQTRTPLRPLCQPLRFSPHSGFQPPRLPSMALPRPPRSPSRSMALPRPDGPRLPRPPSGGLQRVSFTPRPPPGAPAPLLQPASWALNHLLLSPGRRLQRAQPVSGLKEQVLQPRGYQLWLELRVSQAPGSVTPPTTTMWGPTCVQGLPLARHRSHGATWISSPSRAAVVLRGSPLPAKWSPDFFWHRRPP